MKNTHTGFLNNGWTGNITFEYFQFRQWDLLLENGGGRIFAEFIPTKVLHLSIYTNGGKLVLQAYALKLTFM